FKVELNDIIKNYTLEEENGFLFCLYESISNALYCGRSNTEINIIIKFSRQHQTNELFKDRDSYIDSFTITDNGQGFTDDNFEKFTKTIYKTNHEGGKGLGRVSFLKVFQEVEIDSNFEENGKVYNRNFNFNNEGIDDNKKIVQKNSPIQTTLTFNKIKNDFKNFTQKNVKKNVEWYSDEVLRHFYVFFRYLLEKNIKFEIKIIDDNGTAEGIINNAKLLKDEVKEEQFQIVASKNLPGMNAVDFTLVHIKTTNVVDNKAFYVVDERSTNEIKNLDLPPGILEDKNGNKFYYHAYLKSDYFVKYLNDSRTKLSLPKETKTSGVVSSITAEKIEQIVGVKINNFLCYEINVLNKKKEQEIQKVLNDENNNKTSHNKAYLYIFSDDNNKKTLLKKIKYNDNAQTILTKVRDFHDELQHETIKKINETIEKLHNDKIDIDFNKLEDDVRLLMQKVNTENLVNISSYIMYRKYILNLFDEGIQFAMKTKTQNESFFHNLLLPPKTSNSIDSNLWLLDDLFLYFEGISEIAIEDIAIKGKKIIRNLTNEEKRLLNEFNKKRLRKRIDLLFFPEEKKCVIIEIKDPKVGLNENVQQMDKYAELIANFVDQEFFIENFYTYLITDSFNKYDKPGNGYRKMYGIEGFVRNSADIKSYENDAVIANQYSEVIRYKDIYSRAKKRNQIFFEKLDIN
ncbi:MAG: ATP-binding protein, partial [Planctomycetaceae bacterium]|nr:ATP-binding protein [Planctomycetaceae bacterium]